MRQERGVCLSWQHTCMLGDIMPLHIWGQGFLCREVEERAWERVQGGLQHFWMFSLFKGICIHLHIQLLPLYLLLMETLVHGSPLFLPKISFSRYFFSYFRSLTPSIPRVNQHPQTSVTCLYMCIIRIICICGLLSGALFF